MPIWTVSSDSDSSLQVFDWRPVPFSKRVFDLEFLTINCPAVPAVTNCGNAVFYVRHSGLPNASQNLFIHAPDGSVLLDNTTSNGPGFNAKRTGYEFQVIKVPQTLNEWFIIYSEWVSDLGAPLGNGGYISSPLLYSRVKYHCGQIEVLDRDVKLKVNGTAYTYSTALATTYTADPDIFFLYANRRNESAGYLSLDRFKIENSGITFDKNTGNINAPFSIFAIDASPLAVSNDSKRIALCNRNDAYDAIDILIFDAGDFSNAPGSCIPISAGDLILQPDNQVLYTPMPVVTAAASVPSLSFIQYMERKIVMIAFSPSGRFLYFTHGGFNGSGNNDNTFTYLGQIEVGTYNNPEVYPYKLRLQIEESPNSKKKNILSGNEDQLMDVFDGTRHIQQCYDGNMYFLKWVSPYLFVLPNPDSLLPNDLIPHKLDLSDIDHPNIMMQGATWFGPDQIEGYDYNLYNMPTIGLGNDTLICAGEQLTLTPGVQYESYCWQDGSTDPVYLADTTGDYWVEIIDEFGCFAYDTINLEFDSENISLGNDTVICDGDSLFISPGTGYQQYLWQDGASGFQYLVKSPGLYWVEVLTDMGCIVKDSLQVMTILEAVNLGYDLTLCQGDSVYITPGQGFKEYLWQDGSDQPGIMAVDSGLYWVECTLDGGCKATDTVHISIQALPKVRLGQDTIINIGESLELDAGPGFVYYSWQDGSAGRYFQVQHEGLYWVTVRNTYCEGSDSIYVIVDDCIASLIVPNCFTPNSDGYNDNFNVVASNLNFFTMLIFNRWGQLMFETEDVNSSWDGKVNGTMCPVGTYFYLIKYSTACSSGINKSGEKKGSVTLLN